MRTPTALALAFAFIMFACKSSEDAVDYSEELAQDPVQDTIAQDSTVNDMMSDPGPTMDTVSTTDRPDVSTAGESGEQVNDEGPGDYRVQIDALIGSYQKAKYKGIDNIYFEKGNDGYTRIYSGKNLSKGGAEKLSEEFKIRGFEGAFVAPMSGDGAAPSNAPAVVDADMSSTPLSSSENVVYAVQLMAFQGDVKSRKLNKLGFFQVLQFDDGWKRAFSGTYASLPEAQGALDKYRKKGFKDCYVVPFLGFTNQLNGKTGSAAN